MKLIQELLNVTTRSTINEAAHEAALTVALMQSGAQFLRNAGVPVTKETIADIMNLSVEEIEAAIKWSKGKKKEKHMVPDLSGTPSEPRSDYDKLLLAIKWHERRAGPGRMSTADRAVFGFTKTMELTGMGRVQIRDMLDRYEDDIKQRFPNFKRSWIERNGPEITTANAKNRHPDTRKALIRQAIGEISNGKLYSVTAEQISKWKDREGVGIGITPNQINRILSNDPDMRDLDKYRARGRNTLMPTDQDRATAYERDQ